MPIRVHCAQPSGISSLNQIFVILTRDSLEEELANPVLSPVIESRSFITTSFRRFCRCLSLLSGDASLSLSVSTVWRRLCLCQFRLRRFVVSITIRRPSDSDHSPSEDESPVSKERVREKVYLFLV